MSEIFMTRRYAEYTEESKVPQFTYTGTYTILYDDDEEKPITNYRIRFLTSGTLNFQTLPSDIDVFLVGGGGGAASSGTAYARSCGGGGGGYTNTHRKLTLEVGTDYTITIGAGGSGGSYGYSGGNGGASSAFGYSASGGYGGSYSNDSGGNGGSGGASYDVYGSGGTDGGNGEGSKGGTGQGSTTREFGEADGTLYSTGGSTNKAAAGAANTGDGGSYYGSTQTAGRAGGSGIVIIRNAR